MQLGVCYAFKAFSLHKTYHIKWRVNRLVMRKKHSECVCVGVRQHNYTIGSILEVKAKSSMYVPNRWPKLPICLKRVLYERKAHLLWESKSKKYRVPSSAIEESANSDVFEIKTNHKFDLTMSFKSTFFTSLEFMHSFEQKCILHYIRLFENEKSGWYGALSKLETYKIFVKAQHKITDWWESKWKCFSSA